MKKIIFIIFFIASIACANQQYPVASNASQTSGVVRSVVDGDTIWVIEDSQKEQKIRIYGIDCPEPNQDHGPEAEEVLRKTIDGKRVDLIITGSDRYGRVVAIIMKDGRDIGLYLVKNGHAWAYRKYLDGSHLKEYVEAENFARNKKLGLWKSGTAVEPWVFRRKIQ